MDTNLTQEWNKAKKVMVRGDQSLKSFVGKNLQFMYQGVLVNLPLDGKDHPFPDFIARVLEDKKRQIGAANSEDVRNDNL